MNAERALETTPASMPTVLLKHLRLLPQVFLVSSIQNVCSKENLTKTPLALHERPTKTSQTLTMIPDFGFLSNNCIHK